MTRFPIRWRDRQLIAIIVHLLDSDFGGVEINSPGTQAGMAELPSPALITDSVATLAAFDILVESPIWRTYGIIPVLGLNRKRTFECSSTSRIVGLVGSYRECAGRRRGCDHSEGEEG